MTDTDFQTQVLGEFQKINTEFQKVNSRFDSLDGKIDRLDDRLDVVKDELSQEIRLQGAYLNQAFDRMSYIQQTKEKYAVK